MKLNIGCGQRPKEGYTNIDIVSDLADVKADAAKLPFENNTIELIESYHLLEHLEKGHAEAALKHWYDLLTPGGHVVVECPDFGATIAKYALSQEDELLYSVFGRHRYPYDTHLWGYTHSSLARALKAAGFTEVVVSLGTDYHTDHEPCIRAEGLK